MDIQNINKIKTAADLKKGQAYKVLKTPYSSPAVGDVIRYEGNYPAGSNRLLISYIGGSFAKSKANQGYIYAPDINNGSLVLEEYGRSINELSNAWGEDEDAIRNDIMANALECGGRLLRIRLQGNTILAIVRINPADARAFENDMKDGYKHRSGYKYGFVSFKPQSTDYILTLERNSFNQMNNALDTRQLGLLRERTTKALQRLFGTSASLKILKVIPEGDNSTYVFNVHFGKAINITAYQRNARGMNSPLDKALTNQGVNLGSKGWASLNSPSSAEFTRDHFEDCLLWLNHLGSDAINSAESLIDRIENLLGEPVNMDDFEQTIDHDYRAVFGASPVKVTRVTNMSTRKVYRVIAVGSLPANLLEKFRTRLKSKLGVKSVSISPSTRDKNSYDVEFILQEDNNAFSPSNVSPVLPDQLQIGKRYKVAKARGRATVPGMSSSDYIPVGAIVDLISLSKDYAGRITVNIRYGGLMVRGLIYTEDIVFYPAGARNTYEPNNLSRSDAQDLVNFLKDYVMSIGRITDGPDINSSNVDCEFYSGNSLSKIKAELKEEQRLWDFEIVDLRQVGLNRYYLAITA